MISCIVLGGLVIVTSPQGTFALTDSHISQIVISPARNGQATNVGGIGGLGYNHPLPYEDVIRAILECQR